MVYFEFHGYVVISRNHGLDRCTSRFRLTRITKNNHFVNPTQRAFRLHFEIQRAESVPSANIIKFWIRQLDETRNILNGCGHRPSRTVRILENVQSVREAVERLPRRSAGKHAVALRISDRTLRRIFHKDLSFHPYKINACPRVKCY